VRLLLYECIDWRLSRDIAGHDVKTGRQLGWTGVRNGELLALAAGGFDVFITVDRNLSFQQNVEIHSLAVIVLRCRSNRLADLCPFVPQLLTAIVAVTPGTVTFVSA
jgi:hypothetical protein